MYSLHDHAPRRGMVLPFEPLSFAFNHVNYYVDMPVKLEDALIAAKKFSSLHQMHLTKLAHLAKACTQENPQLRPSMRSIVIALMTLSSSTDEWDVGSSYKNQDLVNLMSGRCLNASSLYSLLSYLKVKGFQSSIAMAQVPILLYIVVVDEGEKIRPAANRYFRYTRPVLQNTLQLMGCKARHAFKISRRVFEVMTSDTTIDAWTLLGMEVSGLDGSNRHYEKEHSYSTSSCLGGEVGNHLVSEQDDRCGNKPFEFYNRCMTIVRRETFLDFVCGVLAEYKYVGPNQRADLVLACRVRERKESMTVLFCGTSGCGKSTLSALLGSRLGIKTVISTDSIRHMMRSFVDEKQNPLLWASTYHAGEYLDPVAVSEAKAKRNAMKVAHVLNLVPGNEVSDGNTDEKKPASHLPDVSLSTAELISAKKMVIEGFKAQSEMVRNSLDRLITAWEEQKESVVVEGVHLSLNFVMGLVRKHPSIIPFLIYIANEDKHLQRFAVRAKYMALDPRKNKYVKYIHNIRAIQEYLCKRADKHLVPKINNTNVDRSVAIIHATVFSCLRRRVTGGESLQFYY
ncbi:hypothetical protein F0562_016491 [Nyssa sinensis]|uniref:Uncharacterized protein n=1 Tax=Nyssa sinensis TaxID=561372 RepID=A0A5J4ZLT5_9ASTE|nr:hypothetical protein F0562_016491 [Nyssa sinensis]